MLHLASLVHGESNYMILLPLAELRDLDIFLRGGYLPRTNTREPEEQVYDFEQIFPSLRGSSLHEALFQEMQEISAALVWLHNELQILGPLGRYCAHMDLKPENILIRPDPGSVVGKWWISDFGISIFGRNSDGLDSRIYSPRDFGRRITSDINRSEPDRGHGPYQPPEVDEDDIDPRKCDIWSFGGVLIDVLAFALGRRRGVELVREAKFNGRNDYIYEPIPSERVNFNSPRTRIKGRLSSWLGDYRQNPPYPWVRLCVEIVERTLVILPTSRPSARELLESLRELNNTILGSGNIDDGSHDETNALSPSNSTSSPATVSVPPTRDLSTSHRTTWRQEQRLNLEIPHGSRIVGLAISSKGEQVAFLLTNVVYLYPDIDPSTRPIQPRAIKPLSTNVKWQKISLGGHYLAIYGIKESGQKAVSLLLHILQLLSKFHHRQF